jgi:hypothetical protein
VPITAEALEAALLEQEIAGGSCRIFLPAGAPGVMELGGSLCVVLQVADFDVLDGEWRIHTIKEQQVLFVPENRRDEPDRILAYVAGWAAALRELLPSVPAETVAVCMPHHFVAPTVLNLARAETADQFRVALLKKSRLGWLRGG